jgi:hypothetical protein
MNEQKFINFKQEKAKQISDLRIRWNDKLLSDLKENRNNRILFMQNISIIAIGIIGAGIFFEKINGYYANVSFIFAIVTISFITLYLREILDKESNDNNNLLKEQNELFDKFEKGLLELESYEKYNEFINGLEERPDKPKNFLLDCSGEVINFLFISILFFLGLSFFNIPFSYYWFIAGTSISFIISFLPSFYIATWPIRYIITKIKK